MGKWGWLLLCWGVAADPALALPERIASVDLAAGLPMLVGAQAEVLVLPRWQVGFGYGIVPGKSSFPNVELPQQVLHLSDGNQYILNPRATFNYNVLSPFIRFYPAQNNFYFQFTCALLQMKASVSSSLSGQGATAAISSGVVGGSIAITQYMPTLSIGHVFMGKVFFFNINMGASLFYTTSIDISLTGLLPDALGGSEANQQAINNATDSIKQSAQAQAELFKKQVLFMPSIQISFGFMI